MGRLGDVATVIVPGGGRFVVGPWLVVVWEEEEVVVSEAGRETWTAQEPIGTSLRRRERREERWA